MVGQRCAVEEGAGRDRAERGGLHQQRQGGDERQQRPDAEQSGHRRVEPQQPRVDGRAGGPVAQ
ncbi:MAG: hypothetical protein ACNA8R_12320, partial [Nitriliruptoraceae bacterium]